MGDNQRGLNPEEVRIVKTKFNLPIARDRYNQFKLLPGSHVGVCLTSDFFLEEADQWRDDAWAMIKYRQDCVFFIITKRVHRIAQCLPADWGDGYDNVILSPTVESMTQVEKRLPVFLNIPCKRRTLTVAPILEEISLEPYLATGEILGVSVGGESVEDGRYQARPSDYSWYLRLYRECKKHQVDYEVFSIGTNFIKDGRQYRIPKSKSYPQAKKMNLNLNFTNMYG